MGLARRAEEEQGQQEAGRGVEGFPCLTYPCLCLVWAVVLGWGWGQVDRSWWRWGRWGLVVERQVGVEREVERAREAVGGGSGFDELHASREGFLEGKERILDMHGLTWGMRRASGNACRAKPGTAPCRRGRVSPPTMVRRQRIESHGVELKAWMKLIGVHCTLQQF